MEKLDAGNRDSFHRRLDAGAILGSASKPKAIENKGNIVVAIYAFLQYNGYMSAKQLDELILDLNTMKLGHTKNVYGIAVTRQGETWEVGTLNVGPFLQLFDAAKAIQKAVR